MVNKPKKPGVNEPVVGRVERAPHYLWKQRETTNVDLKRNVAKVIQLQQQRAEQEAVKLEEHNRRSELKRRRKRVQNIRAGEAEQRRRNYSRDKSLHIATRTEPIPPRRKPYESERMPVKKDRMYYRRRGYFWSDLVHTPSERTPMVIPPCAFVGDVVAIENLVATIELEDALDEVEDERRMERVREIRRVSRRKMNKNRRESMLLREQTLGRASVETATDVPPAADTGADENPGRRSDHTNPGVPSLPLGHMQRPKKGATRWDKLAAPKTRMKKKDLYFRSGVSELNGLLSTDPALEEHIRRLDGFVQSKVQQSGKRGERKEGAVSSPERSSLIDRLHHVMPRDIMAQLSRPPTSYTPRPTPRPKRAGRATKLQGKVLAHGTLQQSTHFGGESLASDDRIWPAMQSAADDSSRGSARPS